MFAIRLRDFGPPENLKYEDVPDPVPGCGQVRIRVAAAGVHLVDTKLRQGVAGGIRVPTLPAIPGREVAGVVDAVGAGVNADWIGLRAVAYLGSAGSGGYAEWVVVPVGALHVVPRVLTPEEAVAMIGTGPTAWAVLEEASLSQRDAVVVTAAAGALGALLVQGARRAGALTVGLAGGADNVAWVRRLGADVSVDHLRDGWPDHVRAFLGGREITVVLDGVGGRTGQAASELLGKDGRMLMVDGEEVSGDSVRLRRLETRALVEAAAGRLRPLISTFPLERAADAHAAIEARATTGKVVLVPASAATDRFGTSWMIGADQTPTAADGRARRWQSRSSAAVSRR